MGLQAMTVNWRRCVANDPRLARLGLAVVSSSASKIVRFLTQIVILGGFIRHLGVNEYGLWLTVVAALGWLSWGQAGLAPGLVNAIATAEGDGRTQDQATYFTTALTAVLGVALFLLVAGSAAIALMSADLAQLMGLAKQTETPGGGNLASFLEIALLLALLRFPLALIDSAYTALQIIHIVRVYDIIAQILTAGLVLILILAKVSSVTFLLCTGISAEGGIIAAGFYLIYGLRPDLLPKPSRCNFRASRKMFDLSVGYLFLQVAGYFVINAGTVVLAAYHGPSAVPVFALTMQLYQMASGVWMMFVTGLWGAIAEARARGDWPWLRRVVHQLIAGAMILSLAFSIVLAIEGQWILKTWSGGRVTADPHFLAVMAVMCSVLTWSVMHAQILSALSYVWVQVFAAAANAVMCVGLGLILIPEHGATGLVIAMSLASALSTCWFHPWILAKATQRPFLGLRHKLNWDVFNLAPMRPIGRLIFANMRRGQEPRQSIATMFFRNFEQLSALDRLIAPLGSGQPLRVLVVGCSVGCEAYSLAGHLALSHPNLDFVIDACDISEEALAVAREGRYSSKYGLGNSRNQRERDLEARLFTQSEGSWLWLMTCAPASITICQRACPRVLMLSGLRLCVRPKFLDPHGSVRCWGGIRRAGGRSAAGGSLFVGADRS